MSDGMKNGQRCKLTEQTGLANIGVDIEKNNGAGQAM